MLVALEPDMCSISCKTMAGMAFNGFQISQSKIEGPLSRLEEEEKRENDEVAAIARKLEEKYVSSLLLL